MSKNKELSTTGKKEKPVKKVKPVKVKEKPAKKVKPIKVKAKPVNVKEKPVKIKEKQAKVKPIKEKLKKQKPVKKSAPKNGRSKKFIALVATLALFFAAGVTMGSLWLAGVFNKPGTGTPADASVSFISTLEAMEIEQVEGRELAATYQDSEGALHLLYRTGSIKSMFIELLTIPEKRTNLNANGEISFTKGTISSTAITEGVTKNITNTNEHNVGGSISVMGGYGLGGAGWGGSVTVEVHYNYTTSKSESFETSKYKEIGTSISVEETHSCPLSECTEGYYYAYAAYADFDVFLDVTIEKEGNAFIAKGKPCYAMAASSISIVFVSSPNNKFDVSDSLDDEKLEFIDSMEIDDIFSEGKGTSSEPYSIYTAAQLMYIGLMPEKYYKLKKDINLNGWQWRNNITFQGTLNGDNKTISQLSVTDAGAEVAGDKYYGLFSQMQGGLIENLNFMNCSIKRTKDGNNINAGSGTVYAGIVVGKVLSGAIRNVTVSRSTVEIWRYNAASGGIAGRVETATIKDCTASGVVMVGSGDMGCIAGQLYGGTVDTCYVKNFVDVTGVVGDMISAIEYTIDTRASSAGGMVGYVRDRSGNQSVIKNGEVANIRWVFAGEIDSADLEPIIGFVAGNFQGRIEKVKIPKGWTVQDMKDMFYGGFTVDSEGDQRMTYFFGGGPYNSENGWWWWNDDSNIDHKFIEIGIRVGDWFVTKP